MLILVGVTINFALNGGIINKAKTASSEMQKAADKEELQLAIVASMDYLTEEINESEFKANLPSWTVTGSGPYTCTSPNRNTFSVTKAGVISDGSEGSGSSEGSSSSSSSEEPISNPDEDLVKDYFLGKDRQGRDYFELVDLNTEEFVDDEDSITDASTSITRITSKSIAAGINDENALIYVQYNDRIYKVTLRVTTETLLASNVQTLTYNSNGNVGKTATIDGEKYIVLYDAGEQGENVQLISANVYETNNISLGCNDNNIDWTDNEVISAANIFNDTESRTKCII